VSYSRESPAKDVREALDLLTKARVCHRVPSSHCSGVPLHADINENVSKLLFLDVGLMNHVCGLDWTALREMSDLTLVNEGAIAEQLIGQHLVHASGGLEPPTAVYWLREGRSSNAEVDFVISHGTEVVPVEVKAGRSGSLRSLHQFILAGKATRAVRFDTNRPSRQIVQVQAPTGSGWRDVSYELLSLPLYAVGELSRLLSGEEGRGASR
jgi:predicted AAA+ superfamily ATPase